jgi:N-acetylmuramoyl-L-alanine amidase
MKSVVAFVVLALAAAGSSFAQRSDLSGIKICIDPGHGGHNPANDRYLVPDPGTEFWESESNWQKALLLKTLLEAKGATVLLTRNTNDYPDDNLEPSTTARAAFANANNVNWFHSIHSNATGLAINTSINYTLMLIREQRPGGPASSSGNGLGVPETQGAWDISTIIGPNIKSKLRTQKSTQSLDWTFYGGTSGGMSLGVLRGLLMPGELSEGSMHDFFPETRRLMNNSYRKMEVYAIRYAFLQYFGVPADTLCVVAGILSNTTGVMINGAKVRLLPENIVYTGDNYNNGFYMFDGVKAGPHTLSFETPNFEPASISTTPKAGETVFIDRVLVGGTPARISWFGPTTRDTLYPINQTIGLSFSAAMDTASVRQAFSITPAVNGTLTWYNSLTSFLFKPDPSFQYLTWYTYRLAATARTAGGGYLDGNGDGTAGDDFSVKFRTMPAPVSVDQEPVIPTFRLAQNYPNPFNPATNFEFRIATSELVTLRIFDVLGREVATLVNEVCPAGMYRVRWDASSLPSGVYVYCLRAGDFVQTKKLILAK